MLPDIGLIKTALAGKCPKCEQGDLFKSQLSMELRDRCEHCGLDFSKNDSADGPAVFLIFVLGFALVPLALWLAYQVDWPLWGHGLVWGAVLIFFTVGSLKPLKAYIIALQYKHRPGDLE